MCIIIANENLGFYDSCDAMQHLCNAHFDCAHTFAEKSFHARHNKWNVPFSSGGFTYINL